MNRQEQKARADRGRKLRESLMRRGLITDEGIADLNALTVEEAEELRGHAIGDLAIGDLHRNYPQYFGASHPCDQANKGMVRGVLERSGRRPPYTAPQFAEAIQYLETCGSLYLQDGRIKPPTEEDDTELYKLPMSDLETGTRRAMYGHLEGYQKD